MVYAKRCSSSMPAMDYWECSLPENHKGLHMAFSGHMYDNLKTLVYVWGLPDDSQTVSPSIPPKEKELCRAKVSYGFVNRFGTAQTINFLCSLELGHTATDAQHKAYRYHDLKQTLLCDWSNPTSTQGVY